MTLAFQEMFGISDGFAKVEFSGRTDLYILSEGLRQHGINGGHEAHLNEFLQRYYGHLRHTLGEREGHLMPGFPQLLEALSHSEGVRIGLATGNFSEAAWMKLDHYGIRQYFQRRRVRRREPRPLGDGAAGRRAFRVTAVAPGDILIIGDTPHDVSSALDNGLRGGWRRDRQLHRRPASR